MANIERVIRRFCVETAVYWGNPQNDGYGGFTYDDPVEIQCRWEYVTEVNLGWIGLSGNTFLPKGSVLVTQDLDKQGRLYKGSLSDFDSTVDTSNPANIADTWIIHRFDKIPFVRKTNQFVRICYLYDQGK